MSTRTGRRLALLHRASRWLHARWDRRRGGLLQTAGTWEAQYAGGRWDYLAGLPEAARYSVLVGYVCQLRPAAAVLDAGCGQGVFLRRLPATAYSRYLGIDVSPSAIAAAAALQDERSTFLAVDCERYAPSEHFDVIVFNEVLYCLRDPLRVVERYTRSLRSGGILLVSLCTAGQGAAALLDRLRQDYSVVDETCVIHAGTGLSWVCTALRPRTSATRE